MKILIAEDDATIANSLKKKFAEENIDILIANNGDEALEMLVENSFDALLLDWRMPKKNGLEVCKILRENKNQIPIILLTAVIDIDNKVEALNVGADDYITKPFSFEEVLARFRIIRKSNWAR